MRRARPRRALLALVEVVDEDERRGHARRATGEQADAQVERDLRHGAEPEADADAHDECGEDEDEPVERGKWT